MTDRFKSYNQGHVISQTASQDFIDIEDEPVSCGIGSGIIHLPSPNAADRLWPSDSAALLCFWPLGVSDAIFCEFHDSWSSFEQAGVKN